MILLLLRDDRHIKDEGLFLKCFCTYFSRSLNRNIQGRAEE